MKLGRIGVVAAMVMAVFCGACESGGPAYDVEDAVRAFTRAGDQRDIARLEAILDDNFRVVFTMKSGEPATVLTRAQYLDLARADMIGGGERRGEVTTLHLGDGFAAAAANLERADASFNSVVTLVQSGGQWKILEDALTMTPREVP